MAKKEVKDIEVVEEVKEPKTKEKKKESTASKIIWWIVLGLTIIFLVDFFGTKSGKDPKFCITHEIRDCTDGSVKVCNGLGYKYIEYNRESKKGTEFGPFWISVEDE